MAKTPDNRFRGSLTMKAALKRTLPASLAAAALMFIVGRSVGNAQVQLNIRPGVQLSWLENTNDTYHLQWSSNPSSTWADLIAAAVGNGTINTIYDPVPAGTRTYQILDIALALP